MKARIYRDNAEVDLYDIDRTMDPPVMTQVPFIEVDERWYDHVRSVTEEYWALQRKLADLWKQQEGE